MDGRALDLRMVEWRHHLHEHPELGFEERKTASFVAARLEEAGIKVTHGFGGTGLVGTLSKGTGSRSISLRADMDALAIDEDSTATWRSCNAGKIHACGHDGHTAMLLGAATELASDETFDGIVHFIFQRAEEHGHGAERMIADGLLEQFPIDEIYGVHNMPGMAAGSFATRLGP